MKGEENRGMISQGIMDHVILGRCHLNVTLINSASSPRDAKALRKFKVRINEGEEKNVIKSDAQLLKIAKIITHFLPVTLQQTAPKLEPDFV